jgi:hypothetical protein
MRCVAVSRPILIIAGMARIATIALAAWLAALPWGGADAAFCASNDFVAADLKARFAETPVAVGLILDSKVMQVFASDIGTWSVVLTDTRGIACIVAAGTDWTTVTPPPEPEGDPS